MEGSKFWRRGLLISSTLFVFVLCILLFVGVICRVNRRNISVNKYPRHYPGADIHAYDDVSYGKDSISPLVSEEYECFGTCACDDPAVGRRSISRPIQKGISYFVIAVTSFIAFERAKRYFDRKCVDSLRSECEDVHSIYSILNDCGIVPHPDTVKREQGLDEESSEEYKVVKRQDGRNYICRGNCVEDKTQAMDGDAKEIIQNIGFKCESIIGEEKEVRFLPSMHFGLPEAFTDEQFLFQAKILYSEKVLNELCYQKSSFSQQEIFDRFYPDSEKRLLEGRLREGSEKIISELLPEKVNFCCHPLIDVRTHVYCRYVGKFTEEDESWEDEDDGVLRTYDIPREKIKSKKGKGKDVFESSSPFINKFRKKKDERRKKYESYDESIDETGLPTFKMNEIYFKKQFKRLGVVEQEYYEDFYEMFMEFVDENEEGLPKQVKELSEMEKYHVIANLRIWRENGGDPDIFRDDHSHLVDEIDEFQYDDFSDDE